MADGFPLSGILYDAPDGYASMDAVIRHRDRHSAASDPRPRLPDACELPWRCA
ncbi:MAG: hypothetical protein IT294_01245 [Deltaproteobacteria bacterium]|nr:hypothetical protein [Deltaproteobacteria bacterium]